MGIFWARTVYIPRNVIKVQLSELLFGILLLVSSVDLHILNRTKSYCSSVQHYLNEFCCCFIIVHYVSTDRNGPLQHYTSIQSINHNVCITKSHSA